MFKVTGNFFGSFKIGDNINYNLKILRQLYKCLNDLKKEEEKSLLYKPIIIIVVSIIEALLYDFIEIRIKTHTKEGVGNLPTETLEAIRESNFDNMSKYIDCVEKYKLLRFKNIYISLKDLRRLRNRVHIQNKKKDSEIDERDVFTKKRKEIAERVVEQITKVFSLRYGRDQYYCEDLEFPFKEKILTKEINGKITLFYKAK